MWGKTALPRHARATNAASAAVTCRETTVRIALVLLVVVTTALPYPIGGFAAAGDEHPGDEAADELPDDGDGDGEIGALSGGSFGSLNAANPIDQLTKSVDVTGTPSDPLRPGALVVYTLAYSCSSTATGANCNDASIVDVLPTLQSIDGGTIQLEFHSAASVPPGSSHWSAPVVSGSVPNRQVRWDAQNLPAGATGALVLTLRIPLGVVPALPNAQELVNTAVASYPAQDDVVANAAPVYVNAEPPSSAITKTGPSNVLLTETGTDPVSYTVRICPVGGTALWDTYEVTDTLPVGATIVTTPLPFGGVFTPNPDPDPADGGTISWTLESGNRPTPDAQGCLQWTIQVEYVNATNGGDATNVVGAFKTNVVEATGTDGTGSQDIGPADTTLELTGPVTRFGPSKQARNADGSRSTYYVQDGETIVYRIGASNTSDTGAVPFAEATLTDGPLPDGFTLTEVRTGTWTGATGTVVAVVEVSEDSTDGTDGNWVTIATDPSQTITTGLADVRWVRWVFDSVAEPAIGPGWSTSGIELVGTLAEADAGVLPVTLENCSRLSGIQGSQPQNRGQACVDVLLEGPQPHPSVQKASSSSELGVGDTVTYTLTVGNNIDATGPLVGVTLTDCVPDAEHLTVDNVQPGAAWTVDTPYGTCTPAGGAPANGSTGTELVFHYVGPPLAAGDSAPPVTYDVTASSYTDPGAPVAPAPPGIRRNLVEITDGNGDPFVHCVQAACQRTHDVTVPFFAELESQKLVRGTLDSDFNIAGTTTPGGQVTWRLEVENRGNIDVENVQYIDTFPHVGDTGVRRLDQDRDSEYAPVLVSLIDAPGWTVEYSRSANPCRDEVLAPTDIPHTGCDDPEWTATPDVLDLPSYRSIRLTLAGRLPRGGSAEFEWNMVTPISDPAYDDGTPFGRLQDCTIPLSDPPYPASPGASTLDRPEEAEPTCPVANNSFAYGVSVPNDQLGGLPNPGRLGAEPPLVALHVAAETTLNTIGNRVWDDLDNDGIQDPGESGIPGVRVELLDAIDPGALLPLFTTFTDADGLYLFDDLPAGDYVVRFYLPDDSSYVSPQNTGTSPGGDQSSAGNSDHDSDVPQSPSGTDAIGNYYDTSVVTLGNPPDLDVDGREIDLTWDAGIWIPNPSIAIDKVTKDTSWPDTDAGDSVEIVEGRPVTWIYTVTNNGATYLDQIDVTDVVIEPAVGVDPPAAITCDWATSSDNATPPGILAPGEVVECRATGTAIASDYQNDATVAARPVQHPRDGYEPIDKDGVPSQVTDDDPSSYVGLQPGVELDKTTSGRLYDLTTGQLLDVGPGDSIGVSAGLGVVWHYEIVNSGTAPLGRVVLTDDSGTTGDPSDDVTVDVGADCDLDVDGMPADQVTIDGCDGSDGILQPNASWTIEIRGEAVLGAYLNDATVRAVAVGGESGQPLLDVDDPLGHADDDDESSYTGLAGPAIRLEKATNGADADMAAGPFVLDGDAVVWTFEVTNTGTVPLLDIVVDDPLLGGEVCAIALLVPAESEVCTVVGERFGSGQQRNDAAVAGTPAETGVPPIDPDDPASWSDDPDDYTEFPDATPVTDEDPSHHYGADPAVMLDKATNGVSASRPEDAVAVGSGQPVEWTFTITNTGNTVLDDIVVTDLVIDGEGAPDAAPVTVDCPTSRLEPAASTTCTLRGIVGDGAHANLGTVTAQPVDDDGNPVGHTIQDDDTSHYRIGVAALSITKQALDPVVGGELLRWNLVVSNAGPDDAPPGTVVVDFLPDELDFVDGSDGWVCNPATDGDGRRTVECDHEHPISAHERAELVLTTRVAEDVGNDIENTAAVRGAFLGTDDTLVASGVAEPLPAGDDHADPGLLAQTGTGLLLLVLTGIGALALGWVLQRRAT